MSTGREMCMRANFVRTHGSLPLLVVFADIALLNRRYCYLLWYTGNSVAGMKNQIESIL